MSKTVNRRTFNQVVSAELQGLRDELSQQLTLKLKKAETVKKQAPGLARDYEQQADGLIDALALLNIRIAGVAV